MNAYLIFLLCFVNFGVDGAATITLDGVDSSIVLSGYWTRLNTPITIQCSQCTVDFLGQFTNGTMLASTNFQIIGNGITVNSRNYVGNTLVTFGPQIMIHDTSAMGDYTLYFKRVDSNDILYRSAVKSLHLIPQNGSRLYVANASSTGYSITVTVQPSLYLAPPSFALWPTNQISLGCEYYLYTSGYPSAAGASKYLVYTFTTSNRPRFTVSQIPAYAATIYVPPNCSLSITAEDYTSRLSAPSINYKIADNPINGFVMSKDYPGWLATTTYSMLATNVSFVLNSNVPGYKDAKFTAYVPRYYVGTGQPSFAIAFDNERIVFNASSNGYSNTFKSTSMKVQFTPGTSQKASFLLQWDVSKNEAQQIGFVFISLLFFGRLYQ